MLAHPTRGARRFLPALLALSWLCIALAVPALAWTPLPVSDDPLVRMPGTQPGQVSLEGPGRCLNCHAGYNPAVEPGHNWQGSMMAHAARDFLYWSCLTVAAQDSIWAAGRPNATDICLRCHFPKGWLEGRSDPTNASAMTGDDFDGVQCDFCHRQYDPFFEDTWAGTREPGGAVLDRLGYWDETDASSTPSAPAADAARAADALEADGILFFNGNPFYGGNDKPVEAGYTEATSGQYFVAADAAKRASFADAAARHQMEYSRFHKSKYFCSTCHDVSNPILANLGADPTLALPTETQAAHAYFHVERTFSEFMLSDYGQEGGAYGLGPFAPLAPIAGDPDAPATPGSFDTSLPGDKIGKCQDCHMRDVTGVGCNKNGVPVRPDESVEHPQSGQPLHDLTGGNAWVSRVLASAVPGSPNHDPFNDAVLNQGPSVLTLDMNAGLGIDPQALLDGALRAEEQLSLAAEITDITASGGNLTFRVQNQTGHKLISGFPEGRRMFLNVKFYDTSANIVLELNPYDADAGTLVGLSGYTYFDPHGPADTPAPLPAPRQLVLGAEEHVDALVYEMQPSSTGLTGEAHTFHFALGTDRYKDNRIPPKGFRILQAGARHSEPVWHGVVDLGLYTADEYAGGYDEVSIAIPSGAVSARITLYYQTTSREYIEFLRDEINATPGRTTLDAPDALPSPAGESAYVAQTDPWFAQLKAWGDAIWDLWAYNKDLPGAAPIEMTDAEWGSVPGPPEPPCPTLDTPANVTAQSGKKKVTVSWDAVVGAGGHTVYYDQADKLQWVADVDASATSYTDTGLTGGLEYCYVVVSTDGNDCESAPSAPPACAVPSGGGGGGPSGGGGGPNN
jgi:hypothetical protein